MLIVRGRYRSVSDLLASALNAELVHATELRWLPEPAILLTPLDIPGMTPAHQIVSGLATMPKERQMLILAKYMPTPLDIHEPTEFLVVNSGNHHRGTSVKFMEYSPFEMLMNDFSVPLVKRVAELRLITVGGRPAFGYIRLRDDMRQDAPWNYVHPGVRVEDAPHQIVEAAYRMVKRFLADFPFDVAGFDFAIAPGGKMYALEVNMAPGTLNRNKRISGALKRAVVDVAKEVWHG